MNYEFFGILQSFASTQEALVDIFQKTRWRLVLFSKICFVRSLVRQRNGGELVAEGVTSAEEAVRSAREESSTSGKVVREKRLTRVKRWHERKSGMRKAADIKGFMFQQNACFAFLFPGSSKAKDVDWKSQMCGQREFLNSHTSYVGALKLF